MKGGLLWCVVLAAVVVGVVALGNGVTSKATDTDTVDTETDVPNPQSDAGTVDKISDNSKLANDEGKPSDTSNASDLEEKTPNTSDVMSEGNNTSAVSEPPSSESQGAPEKGDGDSDAPPQLAVCVPAMIGGVLMALRLNL